MAYADDVTVFPTNVHDLQTLFDICVVYSRRWGFKFGVEQSKCMIVGKCPSYQKRKRRLDEYCIYDDEWLYILGNVFKDASHVTNKLPPCRQ